MNNPASRTWSPMVSHPEDEFTNFLDFGDLNFSAFDPAASTQPESNGLQHDGGSAMDTSMEGTAGLLGLDHGQMPRQPQQTILSTPIPAINGYQEPFNLDAELFNQQRQRQIQMQQQRYHGPNMVPPTPNSIEMHGGQIQYYQPRMDLQQQQMYEHYRRHQKDQVCSFPLKCDVVVDISLQMNFTPLVSPAVTPLDTQFRYPDYAGSTESFSPLTSPALRAQNQAAHNSVYGAVRGSDTSDTTSPIDLNLEYNTLTSASNPGSLRKSRRKVSTSSTKNPARAVRQSPAMKPQSRRKQPSSTVIPPKEVAGIIEQARRKQDAGNISVTSDGKLPVPYSQDSSGADSVSPEPISEILMPPPATPRSNSAGRSPCLNAKQGGSQAIVDETGGPATPASLMRLRKQAEKAHAGQRESSHLKEQAMLAEADMEQIIEDIILPEPATNGAKKPTLPTINTAQANADQTTPTISARKNARNGPVSAPVTATGSAFPSPKTSAMASPIDTTSKRIDQKAKARDAKKRSNTNSGKASPALRPRISPSIKPLLPEGGQFTPSSVHSNCFLRCN